MRILSTLLLALALIAAAGPAAAQEIFSWWRRGLLEVDLRPGAWVEVRSREWAEGQERVEEMRVEVLDAAPDGGRWLEISWPGEEEAFVLRTAPVDSLGEGALLDHLRELYRLLPAGAAQAEDVGEVRRDALLRRHFQDLFAEPGQTARDLPDTTVAGRRLHRRWVRLSEARQDTVRMGRRRVVYRQEVEATAQLSPQIPIFGVLRSETRTRLSEVGADPRSSPPLLTRSLVESVDFGAGQAAGLPPEVLRLRAPR